MGTSIELKVSGVSLDCAKNNMGNDYGYLFQESDLARRPCDGIDYDYYRNHPEDDDDLAEIELAFVRPLGRVTPRLFVLGHTLESARAEYEAVVAEAASISEADAPDARFLDFGEFCALANLFPLAGLADEYIDYDTDERATLAQGRFAAHAASFARVPWTENSDSYWSEASFLAAKLGILRVRPGTHDARAMRRIRTMAAAA